jgi:hypothetical protein
MENLSLLNRGTQMVLCATLGFISQAYCWQPNMNTNTVCTLLKTADYQTPIPNPSTVLRLYQHKITTRTAVWDY